MHKQTQPVTVFDDKLHTLIRDMFKTMDASQGVGLAATQIGVGISLFIYRCPDDEGIIQTGVVCNPTIILPEGNERQLESIDEGCLSLPGGYAPLARPNRVVCAGVDAYGDPILITGTGLLSRCLQHETDHLNGTVFGDRLSARLRKRLFTQHEAIAHLYPEDWPISPKKSSAE